MSSPITRRAALGGLALVLSGCAAPRTGPSAPAGPSRSPATDRATADLASLEARMGGRLGLHVVDTASGLTLGYRADERFLMCSTAKVLVSAAILRRAEQDPALLQRVIRYPTEPIISHSPVTSLHIADGMTVSALCQAAITVSDNTAFNLLSELLGGHAEVTKFVRTLGDPDTRLDRAEPELNVAVPGDLDTTKPSRTTANLRALVLGDALTPPMRERLTGWMVANTTGDRQIRAGVPAGWRVGDKTGNGEHAESNDIGVAWPPGRAPLLLAIYTAPSDPASTAGIPTIAEATRIAVQALTAT